MIHWLLSCRNFANPDEDEDDLVIQSEFFGVWEYHAPTAWRMTKRLCQYHGTLRVSILLLMGCVGAGRTTQVLLIVRFRESQVRTLATSATNIIPLSVVLTQLATSVVRVIVGAPAFNPPNLATPSNCDCRAPRQYHKSHLHLRRYRPR